MLECLDLSRVKKAGPFLEDCKIYLSGFTDSEAEFLDKVINAANGHRMNQVSFILLLENAHDLVQIHKNTLRSQIPNTFRFRMVGSCSVKSRSFVKTKL